MIISFLFLIGQQSVALCTSCIMFVLTQDRLNMDLDRDSLELMLNLLEIDAGQFCNNISMPKKELITYYSLFHNLQVKLILSRVRN